MFCTKCGTKSIDSSVFCHSCGAKLTVPTTQHVEPKAQKTSIVSSTKRATKKVNTVISISVIIIVAAVIGIVLMMTRNDLEQPMTVAELLDLGEQYLHKANYTQALIKFQQAIEIELANPRGYIGAAEAYIGLDDIDSAINVLELGVVETRVHLDIVEMLEKIVTGLEIRDPAVSPPSESEPSVTMPNLVGIHFSEAINSLNDLNLELNIILEDPVASDSVERNNVVQTTPTAGTQLSHGDTVVITYSIGPEIRTETVPDLVGSQLSVLESAFEGLDMIPIVEYSEDQSEAGTVIFIQHIGQEIVVPAEIRIIVSSGPPA